MDNPLTCICSHNVALTGILSCSSLTAQPGVAVENTIPAVEETAATPALVSREEDDLKALIRQRRHWLQVPEAKPAAATPR